MQAARYPGAVALIDLVLVACVVLAAVAGVRRGAVLQLCSYLGLFVGLLVGALIAPPAIHLAHEPATQAGVAVAVLLLCAVAGDLGGWLVGGRLRARTRSSGLRRTDAAAGAVVGVVAVLLVTWFVALNLVNGPFMSLSSQIRRSVVVRELDDVLPEPPSLVGGVGRFFNALGFPDLFIGLPPIPAAPVQVPTLGEARRAFEAAHGATVRVVGEACNRVQQGSGFVAAPNLVITNAHVIAGDRAPRVEVSGASESATPVLVDPAIDIAVLRISDTPGRRPLRLDPRVEPRGTPGAVVGYPGGGGLSGRPAAVRSSIQATSRDIYGHSEITRTLYELQASVIPGSSGGPFVVEDGRVAGVIVSASTTDPHLAYAISSTEVRGILARSRDRTSPVSTGACVR
jgi:S1-C subfamily serine protease